MSLHVISLWREGDGFFKPLSDKGNSGKRHQSWLNADLGVGGGSKVQPAWGKLFHILNKI